MMKNDRNRFLIKDLNYAKALVKRGWSLAILVCAAVITLAAAVWNAVDLQEGLGFSTQSYISDITREMTEAISDTIKYKNADLINVADSMGKESRFQEEQDTADFMWRKARILGFDAMVLFDRQGTYIISSHLDIELDFDPEGLFSTDVVQHAFLGKSGTSYFGDQNLFYSAPVWDGHRVSGALVGIRSKENMQSLIAAKSFNGKCLSCIVDSSQQLILASTDNKPFAQLEEIFEKGSEQERSDILKMQKNIGKGESGIFKFTSVNRSKNYLSYNPLEVNDWVVMTIVPADLISADSDTYIQRSFLLIGVIFLTFVAFWLVLYRMYSVNRRKLLRIAFIDPLTGGRNNAAFQRRYQETAGQQSMSDYAIVLMDVRNFKLVNEKFGVMAGNQMLRYIYEVIDRHMRKEQKEFAARSETDHFFLCIREGEPEAVQSRLNRIIEDINAFRNTECPNYPMSFRQGACLVKGRDREIDALQDRARVAAQKELPAAKQGCVFYDESITEKIKKEQELNALFEDSLKNHDFQVYLQPKIGSMNGRLEGAEALVRWKHPQKGIIFPSDFIPLFENNGKICRLDMYVFKETCRMLDRRKKEGKALFPVSVNLSRQHFQKENFLEEYHSIFKKYDLPDGVIEFELTESIFLDDAQIPVVKECINEMHRLGYSCSLDDFGSGFSSLGLLKEFDVDTVKLDRRFFLDISSEKARDVIQCLVDLAKKLHVKTVAEGIETPDQLEYIRAIECDAVQGYIFSRPLPIPEFEQWETEEISGRR